MTEGRIPPQDVTAEQSVLGAMLMSRTAITDVVSLLSGVDFYRPAHGTIFDAIVDLDGRDAPTDPVAVCAELQGLGELSRVGGAAYLHEILSSVPTAASAGYYAKIVRKCAVLRRLIEAGTRIAQSGYSPDGADLDDLVSAAGAEITAVAESFAMTGQATNFGREVDSILDRIETGTDVGGLSWGWIDVDRKVRPMSGGQLIVVSARPGMGKSTLVRGIAAHVAMKQHRRVLLHTLEVDREDTEDCIVALAAGVSHERIQKHALDAREWERIARARQDMDGADLIIDDTAELTLPALRASIRRHRPDLVIVDQLQLMTTPPGAGKREEAVGAISRGLKTTAMAEHVPIMVVSKMNRGPEMRQDKRPMMADLRESGSLESDADVVVLLYREDVYEKESPRAGEVDVIFDKVRKGEPTTVVLAAQLHFSRFVDMAAS
jgi:replicative DNA helicase